MKPLIILTGPTAVGKTELSLSLAEAIGGEIISADSMQVYQHMDIGTAKLPVQQRRGIPHYLMDHHAPDDEYNVAIFQSEAKQAIQTIYSHNHIPIITGGTGFYIQALLYDVEFTEEDNKSEYRKELLTFSEQHGSEALYDCLLQQDPEYAAIVHPNNTKRIIRALEYIKQHNKKFSEHNREQQMRMSPYQFLYFVLNDDRQRLYNRIDARVDTMIAQGLVQEVKGLLAAGYTGDLVSMQGLGYKEIIPYLEGECSLEQSIDTLKKSTRHFAKRQLTWFRREKETLFINKNEYSSEQDILQHMIMLCKERKLIK